MANDVCRPQTGQRGRGSTDPPPPTHHSLHLQPPPPPPQHTPVSTYFSASRAVHGSHCGGLSGSMSVGYPGTMVQRCVCRRVSVRGLFAVVFFEGVRAPSGGRTLSNSIRFDFGLDWGQEAEGQLAEGHIKIRITAH